MYSQLTRAAVSILANIAEEQARHGTGAFLHFPGVAHGSLAEPGDAADFVRKLESPTVRERQQSLKRLRRNREAADQACASTASLTAIHISPE